MPFPDICVEDKVNCPNEWPTLQFQQQTCGKATVTLRNLDGSPFDFDPDAMRVCFVTKQLYTSTRLDMNIVVDITGEPGQVCVDVNEEDTLQPGMFLGEFVVYQTAPGDPEGSSSSNGSEVPIAPPSPPEDSSESSSSGAAEEEFEEKVIRRFPCFAEVQINLTNLTGRYTNGGVTIAEIRLAIRDKCPEENFLLDCVEFTDTEIAWAIRRPLDLWNDTPPDLRRFRYTPATFPFRYYWIQGAAGELFQMATYHYERNNLRYAAGNLSVDDKSQRTAYQEFADRLREECYRWMLQKKKELNMSQCYGTTNLQSFGNIPLTLSPGSQA
jgi:hypothetical protein